MFLFYTGDRYYKAYFLEAAALVFGFCKIGRSVINHRGNLEVKQNHFVLFTFSCFRRSCFLKNEVGCLELPIGYIVLLLNWLYFAASVKTSVFGNKETKIDKEHRNFVSVLSEL